MWSHQFSQISKIHMSQVEETTATPTPSRCRTPSTPGGLAEHRISVAGVGETGMTRAERERRPICFRRGAPMAGLNAEGPTSLIGRLRRSRPRPTTARAAKHATIPSNTQWPARVSGSRRSSAVAANASRAPFRSARGEECVRTQLGHYHRRPGFGRPRAKGQGTRITGDQRAARRALTRARLAAVSRSVRGWIDGVAPW